MEWSAFGPRASTGSIDRTPPNGSIDSASRNQWSSSQRAFCVSQNNGLQALLNDEIHKSGFLTSAGHKAVVQSFLYSDAVDQEMSKAQDRKPQEGLFRRLMSSDGSVTGSVTSSADGLFRRLVSSDGSVTSNAGSVNSSRARRRGSRDLLAGALRRFSADLTMEIDFDPPCDAYNGTNGSTGDRVGRNIAPRRSSRKRTKMGASLPPNGAGGGAGGRRSERSVDAWYCKYADACASDVLESMRRSKDASRACMDPTILETRGPAGLADAMGGPPGTEPRGDGRGDGSVRSDDDSCADECGWLPCPEEKSCAPDGDVHMVSMENLQED